jgi:hypothetical protein
VKTGEQTFCIIGEWASFKKLAEARPEMIGMLDTFRDDLDDLGGGLGVTDPVSGEVVFKLPASKPARKKKPGGKNQQNARSAFNFWSPSGPHQRARSQQAVLISSA